MSRELWVGYELSQLLGVHFSLKGLAFLYDLLHLTISELMLMSKHTSSGKQYIYFIFNLSVCVYRPRDRNTVSHNPEYNNKDI